MKSFEGRMNDMNEKIPALVGFIGSLVSILGFFGIDANDLHQNRHLLYIPVAIAACFSLWMFGRSQWKLFSSARTDFELNPPEKRLRNWALFTFLVCLFVFAVLLYKVEGSFSSAAA